ncbi:hypothetical protein NSQ26_09890 [Bacillus sp. FSL W7-1360]
MRTTKRFLCITVIVLGLASLGGQVSAEVQQSGPGMPEIKSHANYK